MKQNNYIETEGLILRPFSMEDVSDLYRMSQEEAMAKWIPDQVYDDEEETTEVVEFLMAQYKGLPTPTETPYILGVVLKETKELIGHVGLSPIDNDVEIGYAIAKDQQGKGYATEAVVAMTQWGLDEIGLSKVLGIVDSDNQGSCRVLEKSGYVLIEEKEKEAFGRKGLCRTYQKEK